MIDIPIWKFGSRWEALLNYTFHPKANAGVPKAVADTAKERRSDQGRDLVLVTLIPANATVIFFLFKRIDDLSKPMDILHNKGNFSIICYVFIGLLYSLYLAAYYRLIWDPYYSLYEETFSDRKYFILYALFYFLVSIVGMLANPMLWPLFLVALLIPLVFKKIQTQRRFCDAVEDYLNSTDVTDNVDEFIASDKARRERLWVKQLISARALSISFTTNFIVWGLVFFVLSLFLVALSYMRPTINGDWVVGTHQLASGILVFFLGVFFVMKTVGGGIKRMQRQLENGEWAGFSIFRKPWA